MKALLFDLYGTLVIRQERQFLREINKYYLPVSEDPAMLSKLGAFGLELIQKLMVTDLDTHELPSDILAMFPQASAETVDDLRRNFRKALASESRATRLIPGVKTILAFFRQRGYKIGIISNASTLHKQPLFDFDLDRFIDISVFSCDLGHAKPKPEIYHAACQRLQIVPEDAVFIGDSYNMDVKVPCQLGMQAIHVSKAPRHQYRMAHITEMGLWGVDPKICSFAEVLNTHSALLERQISFHSWVLFSRHPDRAWLTYLCSGTQAGSPRDFFVQRAIRADSSTVEREVDGDTLQLSIAEEMFRITPSNIIV